MSITTNCGKVARELRLTGKTLFSVKDIIDAVEKCTTVRSRKGVNDYLGDDGYLFSAKYIHRCKGGWELTDASKKTSTITVKVSPGQNTVEVLNAIGVATKRFGNIVELSMEV